MRPKFWYVPTLLIAFIAFLVSIEVANAGTKIWSLISPSDSYNSSSVNSNYDLTYISAGEFDTDGGGTIDFWLHFKNPVAKNMFNDGLGSWASLNIYFSEDSEKEDIYIQWGDKTTFRENTYSSSVYFGTREGMPTTSGYDGKCSAVTWADYANPSYYNSIGVRFNRACARLPDTFFVEAYVEYNEDYANNVAVDQISRWKVVLPWAVPAVTTTTTTTTTVPKVQIPNAPSSISISQLSETSLRITWLDNSTNEDGFLINRNDAPVPAGTSISAWPYKTATNSPTIEYAGLTTNRSYCFSISSYNSAGSSSFTDSACYNLQGAVATTQANAPTKSLTCDATRVSSTAKSVQIIVDTGAANAGKTMKFEVFKAGKWIAIGKGRTSKTGASALLANIKIVGKKGSLPIRGTQGSRFICEGNLR